MDSVTTSRDCAGGMTDEIKPRGGASDDLPVIGIPTPCASGAQDRTRRDTAHRQVTTWLLIVMC